VGKALRILKKKLHNEGVMKEVRDKRHFVSKGEQERLAKKAGTKRWHKKRQDLEKQFIREERNQLRNSRKNKRNVQRTNKSSNQQRTQRNTGNQNNRSTRS